MTDTRAVRWLAALMAAGATCGTLTDCGGSSDSNASPADSGVGSSADGSTSEDGSTDSTVGQPSDVADAAPEAGGEAGAYGDAGDDAATSEWWDASIASDPPSGGFLFIGGPLGQSYGDECIYRYLPGSAPEQVFCPAKSITATRVYFGAGEVVAPSLSTVVIVVEQYIVDSYPSQIFRLDAVSGQATLLDEFPASPMNGPMERIQEIRSLDAQRYAALIRRDTDNEVFVSTDKIDFASGLPIPGEFTSLRGRLSSGELVFASLNSGAGIYLADVASSTPSLELQKLDVMGKDVSPAGTTVGYVGETGAGHSWVGAFGKSGSVEHDVDQYSAPGLAFLADDSVLVEAKGHYSEWTPSKNQLGAPMAGPGRLRGSGRLTAGALAFVVDVENGGKIAEGVAWYSHSTFAPTCGILERVRATQALPDEPSPVVLIDDGGDDFSAPHLGKIYSCRPGGDPVDLLTSYGLKGRLLAPAATFFD